MTIQGKLKQFKRLFAIVLAIAMLVSSLPLHAAEGVALNNDDSDSGIAVDGLHTSGTTGNSVEFTGDTVSGVDNGELPTAATTDGEISLSVRSMHFK